MRENQVIPLMYTDNKIWHYSCCKRIVCAVLQNNVKA